jgi:hypothetical protein
VYYPVYHVVHGYALSDCVRPDYSLNFGGSTMFGVRLAEYTVYITVAVCGAVSVCV